MDVKQLIQLRKEAEKAVAEMPEGDIKLKAFEVILNHLIGSTSNVTGSKGTSSARRDSRRRTGKPTDENNTNDETTAGRILVLKDEEFFKSQRSIAEIREELQAHGWHYPATTLSGELIKLVQRRKLRRQKVKEGNKTIWKYSNP